MAFLRENVFLKYGVPEILISDNGTQLKSNLFAEFLAKYNVIHWRTANYHAQANATEAANKTIKHAIRAYVRVEKTQRDWDVNLPELNCALNTSYHTSTKFVWKKNTKNTNTYLLTDMNDKDIGVYSTKDLKS